MTELVAKVRAATNPQEVWSAIVDAEPDALWALREALMPPAYHVPGPYEIAMTFGAALASTGQYATPGAAMAAAWMSVPEFYQARDAYLSEIVPLWFPSRGTAEGGQVEGV